jgi:hypothetical protein
MQAWDHDKSRYCMHIEIELISRVGHFELCKLWIRAQKDPDDAIHEVYDAIWCPDDVIKDG